MINMYGLVPGSSPRDTSKFPKIKGAVLEVGDSEEEKAQIRLQNYEITKWNAMAFTYLVPTDFGQPAAIHEKNHAKWMLATVLLSLLAQKPAANRKKCLTMAASMLNFDIEQGENRVAGALVATYMPTEVALDSTVANLLLQDEKRSYSVRLRDSLTRQMQELANEYEQKPIEVPEKLPKIMGTHKLQGIIYSYFDNIAELGLSRTFTIAGGGVAMKRMSLLPPTHIEPRAAAEVFVKDGKFLLRQKEREICLKTGAVTADVRPATVNTAHVPITLVGAGAARTVAEYKAAATAAAIIPAAPTHTDRP